MTGLDSISSNLDWTRTEKFHRPLISGTNGCFLNQLPMLVVSTPLTLNRQSSPDTHTLLIVKNAFNSSMLILFLNSTLVLQC